VILVATLDPFDDEGEQIMLGYRVGALVVGLVAGAAGVGAPVAPASAGRGVLAAASMVAPVRFEASTGPDTAPTKSARAVCPDGTVVVGTGALVSGADGGAVLTAIAPDAALRSVTVAAVARGGHAGPWSVTAYAICHPAGGLAPTLVTTVSPQWSSTASCPAGTVVYGDGFGMVGATGGAVLDRLEPGADASHVDVHVHAATGGLTALVAYAICGLPLSRVERTLAAGAHLFAPTMLAVDRPWMSTDYGSWTFALGGRVTGSAAAHLDALVPDSTLDGGWVRVALAPDTDPAVRTAAEGGDYSATAFGVCIGSWY
jgi:hypothetical protein